jgi:hypothetical protein
MAGGIELAALRACVLAGTLAACGRLDFDPSDDGVTDRVDFDGGVVDGSVPPDADLAGFNRAFVTAATFTADLGGAASADARCTDAAAAAGLSGTFVALLGDATRTPIDSLGGSRGWIDLDGAPLVDQPADWLTGAMYGPLLTTDTGAPVPGHTWIGGVSDCADWSTTDGATMGTVIEPGSVVSASSTSISCSSVAALACVEIGKVAPLLLVPEPGRNAFVVSRSVPGTGRAGADAICAEEAALAGLPGTYLALLDVAGAAGFDRFDLGGAPWRNMAGQRLTDTAAELAARAPGSRLRAFLNRHADGSPTVALWTWSGDGATCADWTDMTSASLGTLGRAGSIYADTRWRWLTLGCDGGVGITCLQE